MIGNDIVDLKEAAVDSKWQRPRWLNKVFTKREQELIFSSEDQHQTVWLLWSMKEAAYKIHVQQYNERFFNPKRLTCEFIIKEKGIVRIENEVYFTNSRINEDYVYTVAKLDNNDLIMSDCFKIEACDYKSQSIHLKQLFMQAFPRDTPTLTIRNDEIGVPKLFQNNKQLDQSFSLTHHGLYCGFAF